MQNTLSSIPSIFLWIAALVIIILAVIAFIRKAFKLGIFLVIAFASVFFLTSVKDTWFKQGEMLEDVVEQKDRVVDYFDIFNE